MGADANNNNPDGLFDPYDGMDPEDINYVHSKNYDEMRELMSSLPAGWRRLDPEEMTGSPRPPYLHEPSGKTSWKNPNLDKLMAAADALHENKRKGNVGGNAATSGKQVKKLRLMLQAGAPLGAVEQKAKLEGIDMSLVLSPSDDKGDKKASFVSEDEEEGGPVAIPETLVKKYRRMIKAGVPLDRVQQLAGVEVGAIPEQVASLVRAAATGATTGRGGGEEVKGGGSASASLRKDDSPAVVVADDPSAKDREEERPSNNPRMAKFVRMQKAHVPLAAIQNAARLHGHDMNELNEALMAKFVNMKRLGTPLPAIRNAARLEGYDLKEVALALGIDGQEDASDESMGIEEKFPKKSTSPTMSAKTPSLQHFNLDGGNISFPFSRGGQVEHPLTDLVRKMVQTVQKTSQFGTGPTSEMVVDKLTLFHALGSLKGVQFARDEYNSTVSVKGMDEDLIRSKRHGFAEMATSIGMALANDITKVDIEGLDDLVKHIELVNRNELERGCALLEDGYYDFDSVHALYPPGSFVVAKHAGGGGVDCFCNVVWHRYTQGKTISGKPMKYFQLCCRFIVPVGGGMSTFAEVVEGIEMFEGRRSLSASASGAGLAFVPLPKGELKDLMWRYNARGEMYNRIFAPISDEGMTHRYMKYERGCFFQKRGGGSFNAGKSAVALATSGRVVVDFDAASDNGHSISIGRDDLIDGMRMKLKEYKLCLRLMEQSKGGSDAKLNGKGGAGTSAGSMTLFTQIPEEYLALVWPTTVGFSLTSKSWGDVVIDGLSDISYDPDIFDRLVLPDSRKRMIKALVKHTSASGFHDLVEGKGEGTVFLLYGLPGVGKTLTAEAIAESLHRPLYSVSMGTLGTSADELERRLSEILQLSARWDALVLLDEADSFLEARSSNSPLERNAMVSVMLRLVEYHRGILFLTSNRIDCLDPAFQTRITLALSYESLDLDGRAQVWENLLLKSGKSLDSLDVKALAKMDLNGREIKNALRLAMALAADGDGVLTQELLLETAAVVNEHKDSVKADWNGEAKSSGWLSSWWR